MVASISPVHLRSNGPCAPAPTVGATATEVFNRGLSSIYPDKKENSPLTSIPPRQDPRSIAERKKRRHEPWARRGGGREAPGGDPEARPAAARRLLQGTQIRHLPPRSAPISTPILSTVSRRQAGGLARAADRPMRILPSLPVLLDPAAISAVPLVCVRAGGFVRLNELLGSENDVRSADP